jgi:hypothetical protein
LTESQNTKDLFLKELAEAEADAREQGRSFSNEELSRLQALAQLTDMAERASETPAKRRWEIPALFLASVVIATVLLFVHVRETETELAVETESVSFHTVRDQTILPTRTVGRISLNGVNSVILPRARDPEGARVAERVENLSRLSLVAVGKEEGGGRITLSGLAAPSGTEIRLHSPELQSGLAMLIGGNPVQFDIVLSGLIKLAASGEGEHVLEFGNGRKVEVDAGPAAFGMDIDPGKSGLAFSSPIEINRLILHRIRADVLEVAETRPSGIITGKLHYPSESRNAYQLRKGERLQLNILSGEIHDLTVTERSTSLLFKGRVSALSSNTFSSDRNLMPTYLQWLQSDHELTLFWGAALYLFVAFSAIVKWWRRDA